MKIKRIPRAEIEQKRKEQESKGIDELVALESVVRVNPEFTRKILKMPRVDATDEWIIKTSHGVINLTPSKESRRESAEDQRTAFATFGRLIRKHSVQAQEILDHIENEKTQD